MAFTPPTIQKYKTGTLANGAFGFPQGKGRKVDPFVLICIHISGNKRTAGMPAGIGPGTGTRAEVDWLARPRDFANDPGNSAHDYIARDGAVLSAIPTSFAAWNNGPLNRPNLGMASVKKINAMHDAGGFNPNEAYLREVECTGYPGPLRLTPQQRETVAYLIARDSRRTKMAISRETVHLHADLDSVNRANCPFSAASREAAVAAIIARAKEIVPLLDDAEPDPKPDPGPGPGPCDDVNAALEAANGQVDALQLRVDTLMAAIADEAAVIQRLAAADAAAGD